MNDGRAYLAEFIGTFGLIFVGAGAIMTDAQTGGAVGLVGIALAHGLVLAALITAVAPVSGGHLNPAVTFGFLVTRRITPGKAAAYVISQLLGAVIAAFVLIAIYSPEVRESVQGGTPVPALGVSFVTALAVEALLTFFLVFAVFGTAVDSRAPKLGGLLIGLTVTFDTLVGGPITGASMNPARTFGPALASGVWTGHLIYWIGPMVGGGAAAVLYDRFMMPRSE